MGKIVKMVMVTELNNNKYYNLFEQNDGTFKVEYGRVDSTTQHASYPMSQWETKYREKLKKGYKDITELYAIEDNEEDDSTVKVDNDFISNDIYVKTLIEDLQRYAKHTVSQNYKVSTKNVTKKMVEEAQIIIDEIARVYSTNYTKNDLNELLLKLFTVIPRKMGNVKDYLVSDGDTKDTIAKLIDNEQSILDSLAGQVSIQDTKEKIVLSEEDKTKNVGLLDSMGIEIKHVTDTDTINMVKKLMGPSVNKFSRLFEVKNHKAEKRYNNHLSKTSVKKEELLFHGSRSENWISILINSLLVRPSGAVITGKMYGSGIYFSSVCQKSIGYTSLSGSYWANGSNNKAYLGLFRVNVGNKKIVNHHNSSCYSFDNKTIFPYDSVYAPAGADLRNDETIVYLEDKCKIQYLLEINN
jgi:poly [ADP-ribose] polymerase